MPVTAHHQTVTAATLETIVRTRRKNLPLAKKPVRHILKTGLLTADIFTISFNYLQQPAQMKVLKISYPGRRAIYKVIISSGFRQTVRDCWLQHGPQGWVILLGQGLADELKRAITTAISFQEFLAI
jgi:hypothetical protein